MRKILCAIRFIFFFGAVLRLGGTLMGLHPISLVANAPHPNTARLFIDYVLSEEGQTHFSLKGRVAARPRIKPEGFPSHLRLHPSRLKLADKLEENHGLFRSIFLQ